MGLRDRLRRVERKAEVGMISFTLEDGAVKRFHEADYWECFPHEMNRGRRHYLGEEPGPAHPMVEALRKVSEAEMKRVMSEHGTMMGMMVGEDRIIRGEEERPGPAVTETSPGVYE